MALFFPSRGIRGGVRGTGKIVVRLVARVGGGGSGLGRRAFGGVVRFAGGFRLRFAAVAGAKSDVVNVGVGDGGGEGKLGGLEAGGVDFGVADEGCDFLVVAEVLPLGEAIVANAVGDFVDSVDTGGRGSGLEVFRSVEEEGGLDTAGGVPRVEVEVRKEVGGDFAA